MWLSYPSLPGSLVDTVELELRSLDANFVFFLPCQTVSGSAWVRGFGISSSPVGFEGKRKGALSGLQRAWLPSGCPAWLKLRDWHGSGSMDQDPGCEQSEVPTLR